MARWAVLLALFAGCGKEPESKPRSEPMLPIVSPAAPPANTVDGVRDSLNKIKLPQVPAELDPK